MENVHWEVKTDFCLNLLLTVDSRDKTDDDFGPVLLTCGEHAAGTANEGGNKGTRVRGVAVRGCP